MNFLSCLFLLLLLHTGGAPVSISFSTHSAKIKSNTTIPCKFKKDFNHPVYNASIVSWHFEEKIILRYPDTHQSTDQRLSINPTGLSKGIADLHISRVLISDGGLYTCLIEQTPEKKRDIRLDVYAVPLLFITKKSVLKNKEETLTCMVRDFFPLDISVTWIRDGELLKHQIMGRPQKTKDGTYQVTSNVTITATDNDQNRTYSCRVRHSALPEDLQEDFQLQITEESSDGIIVACALGGLLMIGALIGFLYWKQKRKGAGEGIFIVKDIEGPSKLVAGEEAILYCTAANCSENMSMTWLKKRGGKVSEILEPNTGDMEAEERLLGASYIVHSEKEGSTCSSSLKFRPNVAEHKDITLICRCTCGKEQTEKTFQCKTIYVKPEQIKPVSRSLYVSGKLKYSITLEKFFPRYITIRWTGVGKSQEAFPSRETVTETPEGTYSVCSEVTIAEDLLKNPNFRVRVSWEHEALDTPGYRELSLRDSEYPWTPVVEDIPAPRLFHGTLATLQCNISEYFPGDVTVTWLRQKKESPEMVEESEALVSRIVTPWKAADNTYSCTASLTITPTLRLHQGAAYICRVEHPSLEKPIEKRTGDLEVIGKPQMIEPIEISMDKSSRVHFTLRLQRVYPKDILIQWSYGTEGVNHVMTHIETLEEHEDLTHNVTSVGRISVNAFTDPQPKVFVKWKHVSMDEPESRSLSLRDLPWKPQVGEIIIPKLVQDKSATLQCNISDYFPDYLGVSWFRKGAGTKSEASLTPLPKDNYKVKNKEKKNNLFSCQSLLTFTPSLSRDQGAEFICRVEHPSLELPIRRSTGTIAIGKPQMIEPIEITMGMSSQIDFTLHLQTIHPKDIQIQWSYESESINYKIQQEETFRKNEDMTSYVTSVGHVSVNAFSDPHLKVFVTWKHESTDEPKSRSLFLKDLPWKPQVGEIIIPKLVQDKSATLQCNISDYFPDYLAVSWFRKEAGTESEASLTPLPKDTYKVKNKEKKNNLFSCQSLLTFTPSLSRDQGAEFICRVEHPSLELPIERSTRPIAIDKDF